jgi:hypothetical protein
MQSLKRQGLTEVLVLFLAKKNQKARLRAPRFVKLNAPSAKIYVTRFPLRYKLKQHRFLTPLSLLNGSPHEVGQIEPLS